MRRRPDTLLPLEAAILQQLASIAGSGVHDMYGFELARRIAEAKGARQLTGHGTLYKALARLDRAGFVESRWEDPDVALAAGRPRRRIYVITPAGGGALSALERANSRAAFHPDRPVSL